MIDDNKLIYSRECEYLIVNSFLENFTVAHALSTALDIGLIDLIKEQGSCSIKQASQTIEGDQMGLQLLCDLLQSASVVNFTDDRYALSSEFIKALKYRDFLQAQIDFASLVTPDIINLFPLLIQSAEAFMRKAQLFELFDYNRALEVNEDNYQFTARWMNYTTALTRYESRVCMAHHNFSQYKTMMDIGGNSGEFTLQLCKQNPQLSATVIDLPVVCSVGRNHVGREPESKQIQFVEADALNHNLPKSFDLITFKSILHDWPEFAVERFLENASHSLKPGGTLMIFERSRLEISNKPLPYYMVPMLLFFRSFRSPEFYRQQLTSLGFVDISIDYIMLESSFYLLTAEKAGR